MFLYYENAFDCPFSGAMKYAKNIPAYRKGDDIGTSLHVGEDTDPGV